MKYLSLFSGIGGFELGIQRAFDNRPNIRNGAENVPENNTNTTQPQVRASCIGYSEIDKYAIKIYERNFSGHTNYGDATKINPTELPDFGLLVGGFPCQAFSIAGKRKGFDDTRGTLFFDIARILAEKRPRHLVLENVKGLLSHDGGKTFQTILGVLSDLGYRVEWQVLNSKDFGVPQNRERIYFVGHLRGECSGEVLPIRQDGTEFDKWRQGVQRKIPDDTHIKTSINSEGKLFQDGSNGHIYQINQPKHSNDRVYSDEGISPTLNTMQGGNRQPFISQEPRIRRLTPLECERLQGFPDNFTKYDQDGNEISDTQRYKMAGNAVTVNVVEAVITNLIKHIGARDA